MTRYSLNESILLRPFRYSFSIAEQKQAFVSQILTKLEGHKIAYSMLYMTAEMLEG